MSARTPTEECDYIRELVFEAQDIVSLTSRALAMCPDDEEISAAAARSLRRVSEKLERIQLLSGSIIHDVCVAAERS